MLTRARWPRVLCGLTVLAALGLATSVAPQASASSQPARYQVFVAPAPLGQDAGEPSIGHNPRTGATLFQAGTQTLRVGFNNSGGRTSASWKDVSFATTNKVSLDPILFTERSTGRTLVSQLVSGCSISAVTTDDGANWTPAQGCSTPGGADHQTIGGGHTTSPASLDKTIYYYCSQDMVVATCGTSLNGGLTYGPGVPIYTLDAVPAPGPVGCAGLHGHVKVAPDGTAYVPNFECGNTDPATQRQAVVVSADDGLTWTVRRIPDARPNPVRSDPSVGIDAAGKAYFAYEDFSGRIKVATTQDRGVTWTRSLDLGAPVGVKYAVFPAVTAGSNGRAAVAWLGATQATDAKDLYETAGYDGVWHLYVALTADGGVTWQTTDVTPKDPVQRGCIYWGNGSCPAAARNLLDFMDITYDAQGRVLVGYADGCVGDCVTDQAASRSAVASIARLTCGRGLLAAGDAAIAASCTGSRTRAAPTSSTRRAPSSPSRGLLAATGANPTAPVAAVSLLALAWGVRRFRSSRAC